MKPSLMKAKTLEQLSSLDNTTKLETMALIRNRIQVISGQAQLAAYTDARVAAQAKCKAVVRDCDRLIAELESLLQVKAEEVEN